MTSHTQSVPDQDGQSADAEGPDAPTETPQPADTPKPAGAATKPKPAAAAAAGAENDKVEPATNATDETTVSRDADDTAPIVAKDAAPDAPADEPVADETAAIETTPDATDIADEPATVAAADVDTPDTAAQDIPTTDAAGPATSDAADPAAEGPRRPARWAIGAAAAGVVAVLGVVGTLAFNQDNSEQTPPGTTVGSTAAPAAAQPVQPNGKPPASSLPQPPGFVLPALNGSGTVRLDDLRGKPTVVNLFASWCDVCDLELPAFVKLSRELTGKANFVGVDSMETGDPNLMVRRHHLESWKLAKDIGPRGRALHDQLAPGFAGMPITAFYDANGRLVHVKRGGLLEDDLRDTLDQVYGKLG